MINHDELKNLHGYFEDSVNAVDKVLAQKAIYSFTKFLVSVFSRQVY